MAKRANPRLADCMAIACLVAAIVCLTGLAAADMLAADDASDCPSAHQCGDSYGW